MVWVLGDVVVAGSCVVVVVVLSVFAGCGESCDVVVVVLSVFDWGGFCVVVVVVDCEVSCAIIGRDIANRISTPKAMMNKFLVYLM